jgi:serine/threonine protein kinase/WD40 repeat protein
MTPRESMPERDPVEQLAESFLARYRSGERPSLTEYAAAHPELADDILDVFPALVEMERLKSGPDDPTEFHDPNALELKPVPTRLGDYRIVREVGRGGMGVVYEAVQESLGRRVALKVLPPEYMVNPTYLKRFHREARSAAGLHHSNIVPVFGVGEHAGHHYFAMQFIRGQTLEAVLHEVRKLHRSANPETATAQDLRSLEATGIARGLFTEPLRDTEPGPTGAGVTIPESRFAGGWSAADVPPRAGSRTTPAGDSSSDSLAGQAASVYCRSVARIGLQVAEALAYAHDQGVLHRDIKPSNLLMDLDGTAWVADFGLAKLAEGDNLSASRDVVGTLRYMAPERFDGWSDRRSDVYGLGVTLYELLTLRPAFDVPDQANLIRQVLRETPPSPRRLNRQVPRDLETVVLKAMAKEPAERYASADALAEDLRRYLGDRTILARRSTPQERTWRWCRRNPALAGSLAAVTLLLVILAVGSTSAALSLRRSASRFLHQRDLAAGQAARAERAERDATEKLWGAYLIQARAGRGSGQVGRRFEGLDALTRAAALDTLPGRRGELRDEAIACMPLVDLRATKDWEVGNLVFGRHGSAFDAGHEQYVRLDGKGLLSVRRTADDAETHRLPVPPRSADYWPVFSPGGRYLFIGYPETAERSNYQLWDLQRSERLAGLPVVLTGLGFRPDGLRMAIAQPDGKVNLFDLPSLSPAGRWDAGGPTSLLEFRPDGSQLATSRIDGHEIQIRDPGTGRVLRTLSCPAAVAALAWRGDGRLLAASCGTKILVWDMTSGAILSVLDGHINSGITIAFSHRGDLLESASWDGTTRLWDPVGGRELVRLPGSALGWGPDDRSLLVWQGTKVVSYEVSDGAECRSLPHGLFGNRTPPRHNGPWEVDFSPDGRLLVSSSIDGVRIYRAEDGAELCHLPIGHCESAVFLPGGDLVTNNAVVGLARWPARDEADGSVRFGPPSLIDLPENPSGTWRRVVTDRAGARLLVTDRGNGQAVLLNADVSRRRLLLLHPNIAFAALSADGRWAATACWKGANVKVWDTASGALVKEWATNDATVRFSPDSRWLVICHGDAYRFYKVGSWEPGPAVPHGDPDAAAAMAFRGDGRLIAVLNKSPSPGSIRLIETATGREVATLQAPGSFANSLCFSPNGLKLATATNIHRIQLWDLGLVRRQLAAMGLDQGFPDDPAPGTSGSPSRRPGPPRVVADLGNARELVEDAPTEENLSRLTDEVKTDPAAAEAYLHRGRVLQAMRRNDEAMADFNRAIRLRPDDGRPLADRASLHLEFKRFGPAVADYEASLAIDPQRAEAVNGLAWLLATCPDPKFLAPGRAVGLAEKVVALAPDRGIYWNTLGVARYRAGDWAASIESLSKSMELRDGGDGFDWFFMAMAHHQQGDRPHANCWFDKADRWLQTSRPRDEELLRFRAEAEALLGRKGRSIKVGENAGPRPE